MNFKKFIEFGVIVLIAFLIITGLSYYNAVDKFSKKWDSTFKSGLEEQDEVEYIDNAYDVAWNEVEKKANEVHEPMSLDPDFLSRHFDVDNLADLETLVQSGMDAVRKDMKQGSYEYKLMKALMNTNEISYITEEDVQKTYDQFNMALDKLAQEKQMSKSDYLNSYYDMSDDDFQELIKKKTDDMRVANQKALEQIRNNKNTDTTQNNSQGSTEEIDLSEQINSTSDDNNNTENTSEENNTDVGTDNDNNNHNDISYDNDDADNSVSTESQVIDTQQ